MSEETDRRDRRRRSRRTRHSPYAISNFYPGYGEGSGRLNSIGPISPVRFQRILPRYDLSSARTRTSGQGPPLIETPTIESPLTESPVSVEISPPENDAIADNADRVEPRPEHEEIDEGQRSDTQHSNRRPLRDEALGNTIDIEA